MTQSGGGTLTLGGIISGAGGLSQAGAGTTVLSAANSYAGATTVTTGTLRAGVANAFSSASATTVAAAATLDLDSLNQAVGSLAGAGSVTLGSATLTAGADNTGTTFSGAISGTGGLAKAGTGSMVLSGVNTYGGGTTISAGTLQLGNGGTVGSIAGNVTNDGTLAFNRSDSITFGGIVSGSGAVRQAGTGTTVLTATNTYSGGTTIASGTLQLGNGGTTGAIAGNVTNGGTLVFNRSDSVTFGGVVSGSGAVRQAGTGTTVLTANSSYSGTTTITAGTLQLGNGGTSGSLGSGAVVNDAVLTVNRADSLTIANAISGTGRLVQAGSGTTILTAASSFSGGTTVSSGTLVVNGSLASGVVVASGATLGGSGVIAGTLTVNGTIAPGNSIGTLSVTGTYVQNAGSTYRVEINPAGQSDRIAVTGTATLNGGTVQVVAGSGGYRHGTTTYTILTATGGVTGTFDGLVTDYAFRRVGLAYDATAVYLQVTGGTFVDGAQTINQNAVAQSLDAAWGSASGDFATVLGALMELNGSAGRAALETIGGQPWAGLPSTNLAGATLFMDAVGRQVAAARQATPGSRVTLAEACSGACDETVATSGWSAWAMVLGGTGNVAGDGNAAALSWTLGGFAAGIDHGFAPGVLAGVALGMTGGSQSVATFTGPSSVTAVQASLYASLSTGGSYVDAMAGYGTSDNQLTRVLSIPGLATRQARGRTGAHQLFAQVEAGHRFEIDRETRAGLAPYLRFQAASVAMNGFSEWGADSLDLSAAPWTTTSVRSVLGLQADAALAVGLEAPLGVQFRLGWSHEYADTARPFAATLAGAPANGFTVYGAQAPRDALTLGLGVEARLAASVAAFLRYDGLLATGADAHALGIGLRVAF